MYLAVDLAMCCTPPVQIDENYVDKWAVLLVDLVRALRHERLKHYMLRDRWEILAESDQLPLKPAIDNVLRQTNLTATYSANDLFRSAGDLLTQSEDLEVVADVAGLIVERCSSNHEAFQRRGKVLSAALAAEVLLVNRINTRVGGEVAVLIWPDNCLEPTIEINVDGCEEIATDLATLQDERFRTKVVKDIDTARLVVDPKSLWVNARTESDLKQAIYAKALQLRKQETDQSLLRSVRQFSIGQEFLNSVRRCGALKDDTAGVTLETCSRILIGLPKEELRPMKKRTATGAMEDRNVRSDGAVALRTHVTKSGEALRLMVWQKTSGAVEFANVGQKWEEEIL